MKNIVFENVKKAYGKNVVVEDLCMEVKEGERLILLGPSGCGKSTTLRMIAGLENVTAGNLWMRDQVVNDVPCGERGVSMVFQNYALFPHMSVKNNIIYGLKAHKMDENEIDARLKEVLKMLELEGLEDRKPKELSGGQRQRVALARAVVKRADYFLLDEPLSNLDAKLRGQMRVELIGLHKKLGTTFVYVTHDQVEAMSMADDIVLMKDGYIVQQSSPRELYNNPNCVYAAQFIGTPQMNIVKDILPEGMQVGFRPEKVYLKEVEEEHVEISAKIATKEMLGSEIIYSLDSPAGKLMAKSDYEAEDESTLKLSIPVKNMYLFDKDGKRITLDDERRLMIHAGFAKLAGREV